MSFNLLVEKVKTSETNGGYKPEVKELATLLEKLNDSIAVSSGDIAQKVFLVGYLLNQSSSDINAGITPLANFADVVEEALQGILENVANNSESFVNPPREAESVVIVASPPEGQ